MNKNEILEKSRKDNEIIDERNYFVKMQGADFSMAVLVFLGIVLSKIDQLKGLPNSTIRMLIISTLFSKNIYQAIKTKSKTSIIFSILFLIILVLSVYIFIRDLGIIG